MEFQTMTEIDQTLLHHLPFGLMLLTPEDRIEWPNDAICRMLGYNREEIIGRSPPEFANPESLHAMAELEKSIATTDKLKLIRNDKGSELWFLPKAEMERLAKLAGVKL